MKISFTRPRLLLTLALTASLAACADTAALHGDTTTRVAVAELTTQELGVVDVEIDARRESAGRLHRELRGLGADGQEVIRIEMTAALASSDSTLRIHHAGHDFALDRSGDEVRVYQDGDPGTAVGIDELLSESSALDPAWSQEALDVFQAALVVIEDDHLQDHLSGEQPADAVFAVRDCPWWVTGAACLGCIPSGWSCILCAACGASYLL